MDYKLRGMEVVCRFVRVTVLAAAVLCVAGCPSDEKPSQVSRPPASVLPPDSAGAVDELLEWDPAVGAALVLATDLAPESVAVIRPEFVEGEYSDTVRIDLRPLSNVRYDLFGRSGGFGSGTLQAGVYRKQVPGCTDWPTAAISQAKAGWQVALESGRAIPVALDSIQGLASADSLRLAVEVTRLGSGLPEARDPLFASIPFVVRSAYRFRTGEIEGVVASLQRSIHSEADPREEQLFLIAERPIGSSDGYRIAYSVREAGAAGGARVVNVLAIVLLTRGSRPAMVMSAEYEDGGTIELVERTGPGRWRSVWRSAYTGC